VTDLDLLGTKVDDLLACQIEWRGAKEVEAVITAGEINDRHGTGALLQRILSGARNLVSIRTEDSWGEQSFADWRIRLSHAGRSREEAFEAVMRLFAGHRIRRVLCVPFHANELITAIALHEIFGARLCGWIMDDQNVAVNVIPDNLMREFLQACSLRLTTHPELRQAYERKYGLPFSLLPAVVPDALIEGAGQKHDLMFENRGALLGSFWDQSWFDRLCDALEGSGWEIDWFGNHRSPFLNFPESELRRAHVHPRGVIDEARLASELRRYPFVIVPGAALDGGDTNSWVGSLSLPGRIIFAAAVAQTPVLMIGNPDTCGPRFVKHFGVGETVPYEGVALKAAMDRLHEGVAQPRLRLNAARIGKTFSDRGVGDWLSQSVDAGCPIDTRFEDAFAGYDS
jgi:hypothetical protein